jgi:hypothetical protein
VVVAAAEAASDTAASGAFPSSAGFAVVPAPIKSNNGNSTRNISTRGIRRNNKEQARASDILVSTAHRRGRSLGC